MGFHTLVNYPKSSANFLKWLFCVVLLLWPNFRGYWIETDFSTKKEIIFACGMKLSRGFFSSFYCHSLLARAAINWNVTLIRLKCFLGKISAFYLLFMTQDFARCCCIKCLQFDENFLLYWRTKPTWSFQLVKFPRF